MNRSANGHRRASAVMEYEAARSTPLAHQSYSEWRNEKEFFSQQTLQNISQTAHRVARLARHVTPLAVKTLIDAVPGAKKNVNPLIYQLLRPLLYQGERTTAQREANCFGIYESDVEVANTTVAHETALMEVLAAEASHTTSESEAVTLIGTALPITFRAMNRWTLVHVVMPVLLVATARLVRLLHRYSPTSRRLLRLIPTILRRTVASLGIARQWGFPITPALIGAVMAAQTARVFGNSNLVRRSIIRNALIRHHTVATLSLTYPTYW
jgi:hypothetical protein